LLLPTRGRPRIAERFLKSVAETTRDLEAVEVILYLDEDDEGSHGLSTEDFRLVRIIGPRCSMGACNSACFARSSGEIVILFNDDVVIRTPGWDERVREVDGGFEDGIYLAYGNDLYKGRRLCSFPILSRKTCELLVDPFPESYQGALIDYHLLDIFKRLEKSGFRRICYLPDVVFEHMHYRAGKAAFDDTYRRRKRFGDDRVFVGLRHCRTGAANRLQTLIGGGELRVSVQACKGDAFRLHSSFAGVIIDLTKAIIVDRGLPLGWRVYLWTWLTGRYVVDRFGLLGRGGASKERIRILRIISRMNIGGPSLHVYYLTVGLSRDRFESRLALGGMTLEKIAELRREINFRRDLKAFFKILALILAFKPQIVHTHMSKAGYLGRTAVFLLRLFGRRRIVAVHTFHGNVFSGYFSRWKSRLFLVVERLLGKVTDAIIAVSEGQRRDLLDRFRIAGPEKIRAIPLGFNLGPFLHGEALRGRFRQSLGFGRDVKLVGIVGRLVPVKNHSLFLEAVSRVRSLAREEGTRFVIVGDGVLRKDLEGLSRDLGVAERVVFCGWRRDMASVYADLDLLCLTSVNEGTPVTVIEAMASGVPVAATGVGGVPDLLGPKIRVGGHGSYAVCERGLMCRSEDVDSVAGAVQDVLQGSVPELPRCVARARSYVKQCYSKERLVADIEALYEELMKRTGRVS